METADLRLALFARVLVDHPRGLLVGLDQVIPESQRNENVRGHVLGMARVRRDFRQGTRRFNGAPRMLGIIHAVNPVVGCARVLRILLEDPARDFRSTQIVGDVAHAFAAP